MLGFIRKFYPQVFIGVIVEHTTIEIHVTIEYFRKETEIFTQQFPLEGDKLSPQTVAYIEKYERKSPFSYISILHLTQRQGGRAGCHGEGLLDNIWLCVDAGKKNAWTIYSDMSAVSKIKKQFQATGMDYLFSPFLLIARHFKQIKSPNTRLFVLLFQEHVSVAVFKQKQLLFAQNFSIRGDDIRELGDGSMLLDDMDSLDSMQMGESFDDEDDDELTTSEDQQLQSLDDLDVLDELDDFNDDTLEEIQGLDDVDVLEHDEFLEAELPLSPTSNDAYASLDSDAQELGLTSLNFKRYEHIKNAIHNFYEQSDIQTEFIEEVYVADPYTNGAQLLEYLQDELYMQVKSEPIEIFELLVALAKSERRHAS